MIPSSSDVPVSRRARAPILLFTGITLLYLALSPWRIMDRGYNGQDIRAAETWMHRFSPFARARDGNPEDAWSRHGVVGLAPRIPFLAASRVLFGADRDAEDRVASVEPVLETVALLAILFAWARRSGSPMRSAAIALGGAFATMLWPYAYIGLETAQSLALFAAGYLALAAPPSRSRWRAGAFVGADLLAVSLKSTGLFLLPAAAFLAFVFFRDRSGEDAAARRRQLAVVAVVAVGVLGMNAWTRELFWRRFGGSLHGLRHAMVHDPVLYLSHAISLVTSPNKGLLFYAPLAVLGLFRLPRVFARDARTALFAALTFGGLVAGFSFLKIWSEETWGPRYLHTAVAPLLLCLAFPEGGPRRVGIRRLAAGAAAAAGFAVSILGVLFFYGAPYHASRLAGQNTLEALQGDVVWNPIRFDLRLLEVLVRPSRPRTWVAAHYWWYLKPAGSGPEPSIDLSPYAHFQTLLLAPGTKAGIVLLLAAAGLGGLLLVARGLRTLAAAAGPRRSLRGALPAAGIFLLAIQAASWAAAARRTALGRFLQQAPEALITPEVEADARRVASFAAGDAPILCITPTTGSMQFYVWRRLLYPRVLIPVPPAGVGTGELDALRRRWRARHALSLGSGSTPVLPGFRRTCWIRPDVVVGELAP